LSDGLLIRRSQVRALVGEPIQSAGCEEILRSFVLLLYTKT